MPNLKLLDADDSPFSEEQIQAIAESSSIEHLVIRVDGADAKQLASLANIKTLKSVRATGSTNEERAMHTESIKQALPHCVSVSEHQFNQIRSSVIVGESETTQSAPSAESN